MDFRVKCEKYSKRRHYIQKFPNGKIMSNSGTLSRL